MYSKEMHKLNIKLWEAEYKRCVDKETLAKKIMDDDPTTMLLDCHSKLNDLLKKYQGKERHTGQFKAEIDKLARKETRAKKIQKNYNMMEAMDNYHNAKFHASEVLTELNNFKFYYNLRFEKNKHKQEAMVVKKIVDEVTK